MEVFVYERIMAKFAEIAEELKKMTEQLNSLAAKVDAAIAAAVAANTTP